MRGSRRGGEGIAKPARRSASAAAVLMQSPEDGRQAKKQNRAVRGPLGRLSSKEAASPIGVTMTGREKQIETKQGPSPSRAVSLDTPGVGSPDTSRLAWEVRDSFATFSYLLHAGSHEKSYGFVHVVQAACTLDTVKGGLTFLPPCEIESTIPIPPALQQLRMVDRWQSGKSNAAAYIQPATNGWERRLESAGG
jgi:hypothetical protein